MGPDLIQHSLARADGSAVYSDGLYGVIAGVNGPVEVSRRDELPEEAAIEVHIRPSSGVGGPRERWFETIIQPLLKSVVITHLHPRTLIQFSLQVTKQPYLKMKSTTANISLIPALINASFIALLDSGLPIASTICATVAVVGSDGLAKFQPDEKELVNCTSIHAMAYDQDGQQLLVESAGAFSVKEWEGIAAGAQQSCLAAMASVDDDVNMEHNDAAANTWLREALQSRAKAASSWREAT